MNNYLLGFPNKKERDDFFIALVVILFFISLFSYFLNRGNGPELSSMLPVAEVVEEDIDSDMDGVLDANDKCPNLKGVVANNGCPADRDADGIYDMNDKCPELAGIAINNGCPADKDGDGVYDINDDCPNLSGNSASGCPPDSDGDGVYDINDKCPNVKGKLENEGCPFSEIEKKILLDIQSSVEFKTGSFILTEASNGKLDQLIVLLRRNHSINISIEGHTDSVGDPQKNLLLSKNRAKACKTYLVNNGISAARLKYNGFGSNKPIATNETKQGQRRNRRVEFNSY